MVEEIRKARAEAEIKEIELAVSRDKERDRLAKPGINRIVDMNDAIMGGNVVEWSWMLEHYGRRDPGEPIEIVINSPGGSVMDGLSIYDTVQRLRRKGHRVVTRGTGLVASMATIMLQAGDERIADANVQILVHEVSSFTGGKVSGIQDEAKFLERLNDRLLGILAERSTLTKRQIKARSSRKEWWIDAEEALKLGFVDRVE